MIIEVLKKGTSTGAEITMNDSFKFFGLTIPRLSEIYGLFLILWGLLVSVATGSDSLTSWIPSLIGTPILVMGLLSRFQPSKAKVWMHIGALFGLIAFLGGADFFRSWFSSGQPFEPLAAGISKLMLFLTGGSFTAIGIQSFKWARKKPDQQ